MPAQIVYDGQGRRLQLGKPLSEPGGEGIVYEVAENPQYAAKIYHQGIAQDREPKVLAMLDLQTDRLSAIAAWPTEPLYAENKGRFIGFLMRKILDAQKLHLLYGKERKHLFPQARWPFLIHAAMNIARAVSVVHDHGHIIGDINESGFLVTQKATVSLVDCDSFQVHAPNKKPYLCLVGKPEYTPPELFGQPFTQVTRTREHDAFGLSLLIFQLLFLGRHPFSGTPLDGKDCSIGEAIKSHRFAYGQDANLRKVKPPPFILSLEETSESMTQLFRRAFLPQNHRPTAKEWVFGLQALSQQLKFCDTNNGHNYSQALAHCPWCRAELKSGIVFFEYLPISAQGGEAFSLIAVWQEISEVVVPGPLPALPEKASLPIKGLQKFSHLLQLHFIATFFVSAAMTGICFAALCLLLVNGLSGFWVVGGGLFAAYLINKVITSEFLAPAALKKAKTEAEGKWHKLVESHRKQNNPQRFTDKLKRLEAQKTDYSNLASLRLQKLGELERTAKDRQLREFLDKYSIQNARLEGIGWGRASALRSYGIETAADVTYQAVSNVPGFGSVFTSRLTSWRKSLEYLFVFNPALGIDKADKDSVEREIANKRIALERELKDGPAQLRKLAEELQNSREAAQYLLATALQELAQAERQIVKGGKILLREITLTLFAVSLVAVIGLQERLQRSFLPSRNITPIIALPTPTPTPATLPTPVAENSNLKQPLEIAAKGAQFYYEQGLSHTKTGKFTDAVTDYNAAITENPNFAEAYHELGYAWYRLGQYDKSIAASQQAIRLNSRKADTYNNLGLAYQATKQWEKARQSYEQALKNRPNHIQTYQNLAACLVQLGEIESAIEAYQSALRLNPNLAQAHFEIALLYLKVNNRIAAIREHETLVNLNQQLASQLYDQLYP